MPYIKRSIDIDAPPKYVWSWITEPEKIMVWNEVITEYKPVTEKEEKVGTVYAVTQEIRGKTKTYMFTIKEWMNNTRITYAMGSDEVNVHGERTYSIEPKETGCRVILEENLKLGGIIGKLLSLFFAKRKMKEYRGEMLQDLKEAVEESLTSSE